MNDATQLKNIVNVTQKLYSDVLHVPLPPTNENCSYATRPRHTIR